jgi:hypothetical protein
MDSCSKSPSRKHLSMYDAAEENSCPSTLFLECLTISATCLTVAVVNSGAVSGKGMHQRRNGVFSTVCLS